MRASPRTRAIGGAITIALTLLLSAAAEARVVRFVVEQTRAFAGGMAFGTTGAYERLDGTAYMEVDPNDPLNAVIVNLNKAPRNVRGMVEFSSPFFILKPVDMGRGNHKIFYAINNRGNKNSIGRFDFAVESNDPLTAADAGDGFLLRLGYTIVDAGWQGDVAPGDNRLFPNFPHPWTQGAGVIPFDSVQDVHHVPTHRSRGHSPSGEPSAEWYSWTAGRSVDRADPHGISRFSPAL
jgi:hypothetical protein